MSNLVKYDFENGVAVITLNRPERLNAITLEMGEQLDEAMVRAATAPGLRVVVITGEGRGFCAGGDVSDRLTPLVDSKGGSLERQSPHEPNPIFQVFPGTAPELTTRYSFPQAIPVPVIAAVNGPAVGAGFSLAAICDIRFASREAKFIGAFVARGLSADVGLAWTLPHLVGYGAAADILLSGRPIEAEEAFQMGLVNRVFPKETLMDETLAYARRIAETASPNSLKVIKKQLWNSRKQTFAEGYAQSFADATRALATDDFREGVAAFKEKRKPNFSGS